MKRQFTEKNFLKDVEKHQMVIVRDDGVNRHVIFKKPDTSDMRFDLITWPGYLCYTGDMGTFVFRRLEDMFTFFRSSHPCQPPEDKRLKINPSYWSKKLEAVDRSDGLKEYSSDKFIEYFKEWMDENDASPELRQAIEDDILSESGNDPYAARSAAIEFEHEGNQPFSDLWEVSFEEYTYRFIWCCYALAWGVQKYDQAKEATVEVGA